MKIIPTTGYNIGFSRKGWTTITKAVVAQNNPPPIEPDAEDIYMASLDALTVVSAKSDGVDSTAQEETIRSPSSPWGGRAIPTGTDYSIDGEMMVEGNVAFPREATDEETKEAISRDFSEWCDENNKSVVSGIEDLKSQLHGDEKDVSLTASVLELSRNPDGTVRVVIQVLVHVESYESEGDRKRRIDEERADHYEREQD